MNSPESIRLFVFALTVAVCAATMGCGDSASPETGSGPGTHGGFMPGFEVESPDIEIVAGQEIQYCYFFKTSNSREVFLHSVQGSLPSMANEVSLFLLDPVTSPNAQPPGTLTTASCGLYALSASHPLVFMSRNHADTSFEFPSDDGTGKPIGLRVPASQLAVLIMHFYNVTDEAHTVSVSVTADAYAPSVSVTAAATFAVIEDRIRLPGRITSPVEASVAGFCPNLGGMQFFMLRTVTKARGTATSLKDGAQTLLADGGASSPAVGQWKTPPFQTLTSGQLDYECDYSNSDTYLVRAGDEVGVSESCIVLGHLLQPASKPAAFFCYHGVIDPP